MEEIYKEYSKIIYNYLFSLSNNTDIAEELMQETFYSAVKNINKFKNESSLKTWLCKIAKNKWFDYYKKTKRMKEMQIENFDEGYLLANSSEEDYLSKEELFNVYKQLHKLDEKSKEVVYLRIGTNLTFKEIGAIMERSEEWAKITFYRAKIKLKEELKNE